MTSSKMFRFLALALAAAAFTFSLAVCAEAQTVRFLAEFTNPNDSPDGLIQGTDGNLYGTGYWSGAFGFGDVFRMTPSGHLTTIYSFPCEGTCAEGRNPYLMVLGSDGNFYGVTVYGGEGSSGTFYKVTPGASSHCSTPSVPTRRAATARIRMGSF